MLEFIEFNMVKETVQQIFDPKPAKVPFLAKLKKPLLLTWFGFSGVASFVLLAWIATQPAIFTNKPTIKYSVFAGQPMVMGSTSTNLEEGDARAVKIDKVFQKYKCPITGTGDIFVKYADENNIPYWMVAAVAFQESSCGKNTPKVDGEETYNLYGWGVWGAHVKQFDSMEHGIETVSKYMNTRFFSQGITEPCDIMRVYTPPSKGSWCEGVKFFRDEIAHYETP